MLLAAAAMHWLAPSASLARPSTAGVMRLPGRSVTVAGPRLSPGPPRGLANVALDVTVRNPGPKSFGVARSDFRLSADGDMFAVRRWSAGRSAVTIAPRHSRELRLTFAVPRAAAVRGALAYHRAGSGSSGALPLNGSARSAAAAGSSATAEAPTPRTFPLTGGVGEPWGTAIDSSGNVWFAEPGCDFSPTCATSTPPGEIGEFKPSTGTVVFYTLPNIPGNEPIFLTFDGSGNLWFTTPNNSMIGEFSPSSGAFVGQWPVTAGSGPWDLTIAGGKIWYTEHLASAVGSFDPATHTHRDFQTPSANSNPYGIAASGTSVWFTENNSSVDRIAALDTATNAISEHPIVQPLSGTPHLVSIDRHGHPWWTEGWSNTIATLDPAAATAGTCGTASGTCSGIQRFALPSSTACGSSAHTSGIAFARSTNLVWLDNSLTEQVGAFDPVSHAFAMSTLSCGAHPHDGLNLDLSGNVWWDEEFHNALGELIPGSSTTPSPVVAAPAPANTSPPVILGSPEQGQTLAATSGSWTNNPSALSYQWQRCDPGCANIAGATSRSYILAAGDIGASVRVTVTATNSGGSGRASSSGIGPIGPGLQQVKAALSKLLGLIKTRANIKRLLARNGLAVDFAAPSAGQLTVPWRAPKTTHTGKLRLIAAGRRGFSKRGTAKISIRLTAAGKRLLRHAARVRVKASGTFAPLREPPVTVREAFTLSAHR